MVKVRPGSPLTSRLRRRSSSEPEGGGRVSWRASTASGDGPPGEKMSGFTIYETLRLFLPGALAVAVLNAVLRLATGKEVLEPAAGTARTAVDAIETPATFLLVALVVGLLLYLVDVGERLRVFRGDPNWALPPSIYMASIVGSMSPEIQEKYSESSLSLFFLFADRHLPNSLHQRIYLFGAIYKVATNLRLLAVAGLVLGSPAAVAFARLPDRRIVFSLASSLAVLAIAGLVLALGLVARHAHRLGHYERHFRGSPTSEDAAPASVSVDGAGHESGPDAPRLGWQVLLALFTVTATGVALASCLPLRFGWLGVVVALGSVVGWYWLEVGPPHKEPKYGQRFRNRVLLRLGCEKSEIPQYTALQRTWIDLALFVPSLAGMTVAGAYLGRHDISVLAWLVLILPATLVMTIRKHEARLLGAYRHQETWLKLHEAKIREILASRAGMADLEGPPQDP